MWLSTLYCVTFIFPRRLSSLRSSFYFSGHFFIPHITWPCTWYTLCQHELTEGNNWISEILDHEGLLWKCCIIALWSQKSWEWHLYHISNAPWIVDIFWKNEISYGNLTIGYHLWVLYFKVLNDSDGLYCLSSPLVCMCLKIFEEGEWALHSWYTHKPLKTNCPFITETAVHSVLFVHANPHRVWHLKKIPCSWLKCQQKKHSEISLPLWALEPCEPQSSTSEALFLLTEDARQLRLTRTRRRMLYSQPCR